MKMLYQKLKYFRQLFFLVTIVFSCLSGFSQDKLKYGKTHLKTKDIIIDKLTCKITPSLEINKTRPDNIKLFFGIKWFDKKNNLVGGPEKFTLFIKINNNLNDYCSATNKEISTTTISGLFKKKSIEMNNSISIVPANTLTFTPYNNIFFRDDMLPVDLQIINYTESIIYIDLLLYIGKEKSKAIEIEEVTNRLKWGFILPEQLSPDQQPSEELSCEELEKKYNIQLDEKKPQYHINYFQTKLNTFETGDQKLVKLHKLKSSFYEYQVKVNSLVAIKNNIQNEPKYKECNNLPILIGTINSYISDDPEMKNILNKINNAIRNCAEANNRGSGDPPYELFNANSEDCENTYFTLFDIKNDPGKLQNYEAGYLKNLSDKLISLKSSQDSLDEVIQAIKENPEYNRKYKNFIEFYNGSIAIIKELKPKDKVTDPKLDEPLKEETKRRKFPIYWIIVPVLIIALSFGLFKYLKFLKKGKDLSKKLK